MGMACLATSIAVLALMVSSTAASSSAAALLHYPPLPQNCNGTTHRCGVEDGSGRSAEWLLDSFATGRLLLQIRSISQGALSPNKPAIGSARGGPYERGCTPIYNCKGGY